jgi:hypothetical protein
VGGKYLNVTGWSPDGARLTGVLISDSGRPSGIGTYDFTAQVQAVVQQFLPCEWPRTGLQTATVKETVASHRFRSAF